MLKTKHIHRVSIILAFFFLPFTLPAQLNTAGGEMSYELLHADFNDVGKLFYTYKVTLKLYKECQQEGDHPLSVDMKSYIQRPAPNNPPYVKGPEFKNISQTNAYTTYQSPNSCSNTSQPICYYVGVYSAEIALEATLGDWLLVVQGDARKQASFVNVSTDGIGKESGGVMGYTYTCRIPGMNYTYFLHPPPKMPPASPVFKKEYPLILCAGKPFQYDFSADDPDGDSLVYSFVPAYQGRIYVVPRYPNTAEWPPFFPLVYYAAYTGTSPLGSGVQLDPATGMIHGTGPISPGRYIVVVEVSKYKKDGNFLMSHRKEMQFIFSDCTWPTAQLDSTYKNCKGNAVHFTNYSTGLINSYSWDFGDPTTNADTSHLAEPTYQYPAPGTYTAWLFLNKGTTSCKDSVSCKVIVDSGMNAAFNLQRSLAFCNEAVYDFTNNSTAGSNPITSYAWDFGEVTKTDDISSLINPSYTYPTEGTKLVRLIVRNDIGCADTAFRSIEAFKSVMKAPDDTTICYIDAITLNPNTNGYPGVFSWSPNYNISSLTSPNPVVHPQVDTTYHVTFTDATGCVAIDSVRVKVRTTVNIAIQNIDTTICSSDVISLLAVHDGLSVTWQPSPWVVPVNPDGSLANASPLATTPVIATAHFGSCFASDTMRIKVVAPPRVTVNNDTTVCLGAPVYLHANGGTYYLWSPAATLDNPLLSNPVAHPVEKTIYAVSVYDTLGCPKHTIAYVKVTTFRGLIAHAEQDTMVVEGEPVQLSGSGGQYYQWSPSQYLSSASIPDPITRPYGDITYVLKITNDDNCVDKDSVKIRAFKDADIFVPTAFTPNSDGKNDIFRVFPVGFEFHDLKIFDRWGGVVFSTSDYHKGWDGRNKGVFLTTGTFVWIVTGRNIKTGVTVLRKGQVTLIR